jgi:hypothetical protein
MFWTQEDFEKWGEHIAENTEGDTDGAFLAAEKTKHGTEVLFGGSKEEVLVLLSSAIFDYARSFGVAMEDVLKDIPEAFEQLRETAKGIQMYESCEADEKKIKETIDPETLLGISGDGETIHFPVPPKDVQEQMLQDLKEMEPYQAIADETAKRLAGPEGIRDVIGDGSTLGGFVDERGNVHVTFEYKELMFDYDFGLKGHIGSLRKTQDLNFCMDSEFDDKIFRMILGSVMKEAGIAPPETKKEDKK